MTIAQELDSLVNSIEEIPATKRYWLIRTQSGSLYESFRENNIVALEHDEVPLFELNELHKTLGGESTQMINAIKIKVRIAHEVITKLAGSDDTVSPRKIGLVASQIYKFMYELKKGDIVVIPSTNSDFISFGIVLENHIGDFSPEEVRKIGSESILKRRVKWVKDIQRIAIDPYLHRMFNSQQALNDVGSYAQVIERSLKDFFILDNEAHLILNVLTESNIPAKDLFGLGSEILNLVDEFSSKHQLGISSNDLQVTINLNSPGKIDLKSGIKKTTVLTALILAAFGGGYESKSGTSLKTLGASNLIKAVDEFMTHSQERSIKQQIFDHYKDSLKVKTPEDITQILKQFSENKDLPK